MGRLLLTWWLSFHTDEISYIDRRVQLTVPSSHFNKLTRWDWKKKKRESKNNSNHVQANPEYWTQIKESEIICGESREDCLLAPLLGQNGPRLVLGVGVVGQLWWAGWDRALQDGLLQVVEHGRILLGEEGHGHTTLTSTTRTTDTMDVVCGWRKRRRKGAFRVRWRPCRQCVLNHSSEDAAKQRVRYLRCSWPCRS